MSKALRLLRSEAAANLLDQHHGSMAPAWSRSTQREYRNYEQFMMMQNRYPQNRQQPRQQQQQQRKAKIMCQCCGGPNHTKADCRNISVVCSVCGKGGHYGECCRHRPVVLGGDGTGGKKKVMTNAAANNVAPNGPKTNQPPPEVWFCPSAWCNIEQYPGA